MTWSPSLEGQVRVLHMLMIENKISIAISKKLITLNFGLSMAMNCWLPKLFVSKSNRCIWTSNYVKMTLKTNGTQPFSINLERKQSVPDFHWYHRQLCTENKIYRRKSIKPIHRFILYNLNKKYDFLDDYVIQFVDYFGTHAQLA